MAGCLGFRKKKSYTVNKVKAGKSNGTVGNGTIKPNPPIKRQPSKIPRLPPLQSFTPTDHKSNQQDPKRPTTSVTTKSSGYGSNQNIEIHEDVPSTVPPPLTSQNPTAITNPVNDTKPNVAISIQETPTANHQSKDIKVQPVDLEEDKPMTTNNNHALNDKSINERIIPVSETNEETEDIKDKGLENSVIDKNVVQSKEDPKTKEDNNESINDSSHTVVKPEVQKETEKASLSTSMNTIDEASEENYITTKPQITDKIVEENENNYNAVINLTETNKTEDGGGKENDITEKDLDQTIMNGTGSGIIDNIKVDVIQENKVNGVKDSRDSLRSPDIIQNGSTEEKKEEAEPEPRKRRSRIRAPKIELTGPRPKVFPKDPEDENLIRSAIEKNDFLSRIIRKNVMDEIIASMYNKEISAKEVIIKQGDKGSHMYVSAKGKFQIIIKGKVVDEFDDVRVFGELAILYNDSRRATIKSQSSGRVWVLDQIVYQQIVYRNNIKEQDEIMELLLRNDRLNGARKDVLLVVADILKKEFFTAGSTIVRQGDKGNKFYIIRAGTVTITKDGEGVVGSLKKGDCFGELALLKEDTRQATVKANAPGVECLSLNRKDFIKHFGELESWKDATVYTTRNESIKSLIGVDEFADLDINDLKIEATIGVGGFGRVELVLHTKKKDQVFALKYLKKIDIVMQNQQEHVQNEKLIQMSCRSPFIARMYKTYKDDKYIYFLMEVCLGGDLWSLLQKQKTHRFEEKDARFICGCVLEAFDYLHTRGIIYRDLKPENLLIDANGYIKLTDFGFAKKVLARAKTYTFAGTPEYVAPEIVLNRGHDRAVDYWAYGAFVFEMLTGKTPFRTDDSSHMRTYNRILKGIDNAVFPSYVTPKARHLIEKLCRPIPADRLGMQKGGIKDIKSHRWYLGFDWQKLANQEISSPFKPKLKGPTDISRFDKFKRDKDIPPDEKSGWDINF